jgi:hypothetical protein
VRRYSITQVNIGKVKWYRGEAKISEAIVETSWMNIPSLLLSA